MLWIMEKADGIYPRISRADRSPTWVWQGQPGVRAHQICQRQEDSCTAIPSLHPIPHHAMYEGHRARPGLLVCTRAKEKHSQSSQGRRNALGHRDIWFMQHPTSSQETTKFPPSQHSSQKDGYRSHHTFPCQLKQSSFSFLGGCAQDSHLPHPALPGFQRPARHSLLLDTRPYRQWAH